MSLLTRVLTWLLLVGLLGPAFLLTALRLVQPGAGWAVRTVSFTPFGLPLYAAVSGVLLVVLARAVRARANARALMVRAGALVLVVVLGLLHLSWLLPAYTGERPAAAPGTPRLRVLSFNVLRDGATAAAVTRTVRATQPDVVVLMEVTRSTWRRLRAGDVGETYPHRAGLAKTGRHGTVVLGRRPLGGARPLDTVGDCLLVQVPLGERTVGLLAVHPRYPRFPTAWREDHAAITVTVRDAAPALVVGDFNATYDHAVMRRYRDLGYRSAAEILDAGWAPTWPNNGHRELLGVPIPRLVHIDHVMVSRRLTALTVEHLDVPGSDHLAVVAEVSLR